MQTADISYKTYLQEYIIVMAVAAAGEEKRY
jgi:hypothetical protein